MGKEKKAFKDTKLGKFIKEKGLDTIAGAAEVLDSAGVPGVGIVAKVIDGIKGSGKLSPEEVAELQQHYDLYLRELDIILADVKDARAREVGINQSEHSSWLAKNIAPLLALAYTCFTFVIFILVLTKQINAQENMTFLIVNSITNISMLIVGYYFGSTAKSQQKDSLIGKLIGK